MPVDVEQLPSPEVNSLVSAFSAGLVQPSVVEVSTCMLEGSKEVWEHVNRMFRGHQESSDRTPLTTADILLLA